MQRTEAGLMRLSASEIAASMNARARDLRPNSEFTSFAIDSRKVGPGALFFALRGPNHDGHAFIPAAIAAGARGLVVSEDVESPDFANLVGAAEMEASRAGATRTALTAETNGSGGSLHPQDAERQGRVVKFFVGDTTRGLQDLAAAARKRLTLVVGITGSAGKTTAKEMTAAILSKRRPTGWTSGNLNNLFGLPLTILNLPPEARTAVLEMGMSYPGEIARLVEIADPDIGVILNVREAHLGNFASIDGIAAAKGELFAGMRPSATAIYNAADPRVRRLADAFPGPKVSFAIDAAADLVARDIEDDIVRGVRFRLRVREEDFAVHLSTFGRHNVDNALAALAVAAALGNDLAEAVRSVASVRPGRMRGEVVRLGEGVSLIDDTYNSNPAAMASVLASLAETVWPGRKVLAAGDMLELGPRSPEFHAQVGEQAARAGIGLLIAVGPHAAETVAAAERVGIPSTRRYPDAAAAAQDARALLGPGDLVLVKGSRGIGMEAVSAAVKAAFGEGRP